MALLQARADRSRALNWIQIGSMAGPTIELPSVALRSANFRLQGATARARSRPGNTWPSCRHSSTKSTTAASRSPPARCPLADVETVWTAPQVPGVRTVLAPEIPARSVSGLDLDLACQFGRAGGLYQAVAGWTGTAARR